MIKFAHEHVIIRNPNLRDEEVIFTGQDEIFSTREAAQESANRMNSERPLGLEVYPLTYGHPWDYGSRYPH